MQTDDSLKASPLGKATIYYDHYKPELLFPIARTNNRKSINVVDEALPFTGMDIWNGYEFSWLAADGAPQAKLIQIMVPCNSKFLIESKSFKLYLYSFANSKFSSQQQLIDLLEKDLTAVVGGKQVRVRLFDLDAANIVQSGFRGTLLDSLNIVCNEYQVNTAYLQLDTEQNKVVTETVWSNLLKSNCLVTGHPDWGSIRISYTGPKIAHAGLLQYIVSFREHQEFHEHCVERIFTDILQKCKPSNLQVEARYTRRGGLDINPLRVNDNYQYQDLRLYRQ